MRQERINDAALALASVFAKNGVEWGIFGDCALALKGGPAPKETPNDLDLHCLVVSANKISILNLLDGIQGFKSIPVSRDDVAIFLWNDKPFLKPYVTLELFVGSPQIRDPHRLPARGETKPPGTLPVLDEVYLFKAKLRAAATRARPHDAADLAWMASAHRTVLRLARRQFNLLHAGLALKRYAALRAPLEALGVDLKAAQKAARHVDLERMIGGRPGEAREGYLHACSRPGDVQRGLISAANCLPVACHRGSVLDRAVAAIPV